MIIRRRQLNEAETSVLDDSENGTLKGMYDKEVNFLNKETFNELTVKEIEEKFNKAGAKDKDENGNIVNNREKILDTTVLRFVYNWQETDLYKIYKKLDWKIKYSWIQGLTFDTFNHKMFPFFEVMRNQAFKNIMSNSTIGNPMFLKCYNICVDRSLRSKLNYTQCGKSSKYNIIFIKDLYNHPDYDDITDLYYNTTYNDAWETTFENLEDSTYIDETLKKQFEDLNLDDTRDFINFIFYDENKQVRDLDIIEEILFILNGEKSYTNTISKIQKDIKNITKEKDLKNIFNNLNQEQAKIIKPIVDKIATGSE